MNAVCGESRTYGVDLAKSLYIKIAGDSDQDKVNVGLDVKVDGDWITVSGQAAVDTSMNMPMLVVKAGENLEDDATHIYHMEEIQCDQYGNFKAKFNFSGNPKGKYTVNLKAKDAMTKDFDF